MALRELAAVLVAVIILAGSGFVLFWEHDLATPIPESRSWYKHATKPTVPSLATESPGSYQRG